MFITPVRGRRRRSGPLKRALRVSVVLVLIGLTATGVDAQTSDVQARRTLDGSFNNLRNPTWGRSNVDYIRNAPVRYADGIAEPVSGVSPRYVSNRIFNDSHQNLFSETGVTQWGFAWGQFMDHTFGLRELFGGEEAPIEFDAGDPQEEFVNELGSIGFSRTPASPGTGVDTPRQQLNTNTSYIDAMSVYGSTADRLEWLREGPVDGNLNNNSARLLLPDGHLPRATSRGDATSAPPMEIGGRLQGDPDSAVVAGDFRANENAALQATHELFAREHNRIVDQLPRFLSEELKFDIARRVVGAEQQYVTYNEFLPALGVQLSRYRGYNRNVNATLSNEFAVVGYRAHSFVHGELESIGEVDNYTQEELDAIEAKGIEVVIEDDEVEFVVPLNLAFFDPDLVSELRLDAVMRGLGAEAQYKNDEQIDNQLRSVLFQIPKPGIPDPSECLDGPPLPDCFQGVIDLGAIDIARARDHGMPSYNGLREAYGLPPVTSFTEITGEATDEFPDDPEIDPANPIDDPDILDFVELRDRDGNLLEPGSDEADEEAVTGVRRSTLAARLKAIYGDVDSIDPFVGMLSEAHLEGSDFGPLQHAIWKQEFERLRDGDRFFYANDPALPLIRSLFGIDYRRTLSQIIVDTTDVEAGEIEDNVFIVADE
jgi:hypothetical protein